MFAETDQPQTFRVGVAQVTITPPLGVSLAGYFHDRRAVSVRDDLYARAMVIEADGARVAIVGCDLIGVTRECSDAARTIIARECGIPPERLFISATHTHTGPQIGAVGVAPRSEEYVAGLPRRIADAVRDAADSQFDATLHAGRSYVSGYAFNRLWRYADGSEVFGRGGREDEPLGVAGPTDPELLTLGAVDHTGRLRGLIVNFALHVDVIGGGSADFVSADWPGELARTVASVYGDDVVTLTLQGTCGDINHVPHAQTLLPPGGPAKAVSLGRALAGAAMIAHERAEPMLWADIVAALEDRPVPYYTREEALWAEVAALKAKGELSDFERYLVECVESWPYDGKTARVPIQTLLIGDLAIVGLPGEVFVGVGLEIKEWAPDGLTMVVELANDDSTHYTPTVEKASRGAYGAKPILSRWLCAEAGRMMSDAAIQMLHRLGDEP